MSLQIYYVDVGASDGQESLCSNLKKMVKKDHQHLMSSFLFNSARWVKRHL